MIKSKELIGPSCLTNARDDEPIFVLRANDEIAPLVVQFWAGQYFKLKQRQPGGMTRKQQAKQAEAFQLADQMHRWRAKNAGDAQPAQSISVDEQYRRRDVVPIPATSEEAELMAKLGMQWLEANDPEKITKSSAAAARVCRLASELCNSIDAAEDDIGGHRPAAEILKELGPACDAYEGR